jgi:hypothetical protein
MGTTTSEASKPRKTPGSNKNPPVRPIPEAKNAINTKPRPSSSSRRTTDTNPYAGRLQSFKKRKMQIPSSSDEPAASSSDSPSYHPTTSDTSADSSSEPSTLDDYESDSTTIIQSEEAEEAQTFMICSFFVLSLSFLHTISSLLKPSCLFLIRLRSHQAFLFSYSKLNLSFL